ncbi:uncharacterized protein [Typha latifolia]|uniref:uncharacterized protein isoform X2 n=1 Tax=Typha latifolia TaxID=4733 RepID=UPI003C2FC634
MDSGRISCPDRAFRYNGTLCACDPGLYKAANGSCVLLDSPGRFGDWVVNSGVSNNPSFFLTTVLPVDTIRRFTQSQAVLLEATLAFLVVWFAFCFALRFGKMDGRRSVLFRMRWWISRLDSVYDTKHWLDDQQVVVKRKTELGGTFSVASCILFLGLLSALLYQVITKRSIEVHRVRPANAPDLLSFVNDLEFNITTISSMSCSHLRGPNTLLIGTPGFIDFRVLPLSTYIKFHCQNTSRGPTISLKCNSCQVPRRNHYISWQFVDLPNDPATAVAFQFNLTAKQHGDDKHVSSVSGTLKSDGYMDDKPKTFRGAELNVLKIQLFPQAYNNLHNLKLLQPLFHDFIPGSAFSDVNRLQASLQSSKDGLINTTLYISYLSDYIVEVDDENVMGSVSILANIGGLYVISLAIFLYFLVQCEAKVKKLRHEDIVMRRIRSQRRAQLNWNKLRKFVMYTWGPSDLDGSNRSGKQSGRMMMNSFNIFGSLTKRRQNSNGGPNKSIPTEMDDVLDIEGHGRNQQSNVYSTGSCSQPK